MVDISNYGIALCGGGTHSISYVKRENTQRPKIKRVVMKNGEYYLEYAANIAAIGTGLAIWFFI